VQGRALHRQRVRDHVDRDGPPPGRVTAVDLGDGLFVCGDHRDTASIQGALVSGRRAARAVVRRLAPSA